MPTSLDFSPYTFNAPKAVAEDLKRKRDQDIAEEQRRAQAATQQTAAADRQAAIAPYQLTEAQDITRKSNEAQLQHTMEGDFATQVQDPDLADKQFQNLDIDHRKSLGNSYGPVAGNMARTWNSAQAAFTGKIPGLVPSGATQDKDGVTQSFKPAEAPATSLITAKEVVAAGIDPTSLPPEQWAAAVAKHNSDAAKTIPASSVEKLNAYQEIADLSEKMGTQIAELKDTDIGPMDAGVIPAVKNFMGVSPEKGMGANSTGYNDAISTYNTVRNIILRARSGGAVTPGESDRLMGELGDPVKKPGTFKSDIANFVKNRKFDIEAQRKSLESAGYRVPAIEAKQPAGQPTPTQPSLPQPPAPIWRQDKNGTQWEYDPTTKQPTGRSRTQ